MTAGPMFAGAEIVCPYLGLAGDPATHFAFPSSGQRCHATRRPSAIDLAKQRRDCLSEQHVTCPLYRPPAADSDRPGGLAVAVADVSVDRVRASPAARPGRLASVRRSARRVIVMLALVATILIGLLLGVGLAIQLSGRGPSAGLTGVDGPSPVPSATPSTAPATLVPTRSPSSTPSPTASPSTVPTARPSPADVPVIHVVRRGETLTSIANKFGVTVAALKAANDIEDPNLILKGQRLVIPGP